MKFLISLINYNSREHILECLSHIYSQKTKYSYDVVVSDNDSPDNSADQIKKEYPKIHLVKNDKNLGFGKAHNLIAKKYADQYDVLVLVNPDTRFSDDVLEKLGNYLEDNQDCDILSTKIVKFDGTLDSNGGDFPMGEALLNWLFNLETFGLKSNFHRVDQEYYKRPHKADWVGGTFMLVRKKVIEKIGLFDEDFFMYFEDTELCFRAQKAGFRVDINPEVVIRHASGGSSSNPRFFQWSNEYKNMLLFYEKTFGKLSAFWVRLLMYVAIILRMIAFGILGRFKIAQTYWRVLVTI